MKKNTELYSGFKKKIQKGSIQVAIPFISYSLLITDRREKCGTYSRFPTWPCCFSAKRKISKILCKILNIMSQIFFRGAGGKTAKRKCFSVGVMILTSFPKHFRIRSSKVTSIFNNEKKKSTQHSQKTDSSAEITNIKEGNFSQISKELDPLRFRGDETKVLITNWVA